ncbi:hypothetical protein Tsubulata_035660, partial [Turnera subulata]
MVENTSPLLVKEEGNHELFNISLRPLDVSDIDDFMVWATDEEVTRFCTWEPYKSKEEGLDYIKNVVLPHPWLRAICLDNRPIGAISVTKNSGNDACRGELGYVLASKYWGKGIATRAVKMVTRAIFGEWPQLERIEALVDVQNKGSQRVLEKAGFQREGVLRKYFILKGRTRDMVVFSLLSTDPQEECSHEFSNISFRLLDLSDIDDFMVWAADEEVARFCTWEANMTKEEGLDYIKNMVLPQPWWLRAICLDNQPIGFISLTKNSGKDACRGELGYVLGSKYWGKGIATGAVKMVTQAKFRECPELGRIEALVEVENKGSQRVLEKAGFQREGVLRNYRILKGRLTDLLIFSLVSTDPQV